MESSTPRPCTALLRIVRTLRSHNRGQVFRTEAADDTMRDFLHLVHGPGRRDDPVVHQQDDQALRVPAVGCDIRRELLSPDGTRLPVTNDQVLRERDDAPRLAVLENREVLLPKAADWVAVLINDRDIQGHRLDAGLELRHSSLRLNAGAEMAAVRHAGEDGDRQNDESDSRAGHCPTV